MTYVNEVEDYSVTVYKYKFVKMYVTDIQDIV